MEKVTLLPYESIYENFIDKKYLKDGRDEYFFRNQQVKKPVNDWRHLHSDEIERLVKNSNTATSWDDILVTDEFDTNLVKNNRFYGLVRIGAIKNVVLQYHDLKMACGITDSTIISCDIGFMACVTSPTTSSATNVSSSTSMRFHAPTTQNSATASLRKVSRKTCESGWNL